ncbi:MAG: APC family permease [Acholeplasmatales bacterium]|nr:APC family permease [Acholeplasmatales bacterium]MDY4016320.1 APC family permease [Bacilli bacterium]
MTEIKKQYGIWTGIAMVVGIVIGSGVFLKAGGVLKLAGGNLKLSILAWFIGGLIMITSSFCFAVFATKVTKYNGVVDYVEVASNEKIGYSLAWMITSFYYPIVASIVALFAGSYFFKMIGLNIGLTDWQNFLFAFGIITLVVIMNYLSPIIASKFQISATVVKLIPILLIAIGGLFASLIVGNDYGIINAFKNNAEGYELNFGEAVKKTAFAYEGWVCATAINAELKDSKKNLPKALVGGTIAILVFYIVYYVSLSAILGNEANIIQDEKAPIVAFQKMFGTIGGSIFTFFIMISCLGTVNGVTMGCCRGMYTMSCRGQGIAPEKFSKIGKNKNISFLSCIYGYGCILLMLLVWYLAMHNVWIFGHLGSMDEIICAIIYAIYITMYIFIMKNFKELNVVKRFILPGLAIIGSLFFTICGTGLYQLITTGKTNSLIDFLVFLVLFIILMLPSLFFYHKDGKKETIDD